MWITYCWFEDGIIKVVRLSVMQEVYGFCDTIRWSGKWDELEKRKSEEIPPLSFRMSDSFNMYMHLFTYTNWFMQLDLLPHANVIWNHYCHTHYLPTFTKGNHHHHHPFVFCSNLSRTCLCNHHVRFHSALHLSVNAADTIH